MLILASGSPRRRELLDRLGIPFRVIVSGESEATNSASAPEKQAIALAQRKARAVAAQVASGFVLGADTIVVLNGDVFGKPQDAKDAVRMLRMLSGRDHEVITGIALVDAGSDEERASAVSSTVQFRPLSDNTIADYVASGESHDKAGAYAIQGLGAHLIADLDGCFTNVVGLPLCETARLISEAGIVIPTAWPGCRLPDGATCPRQDQADSSSPSRAATDEGRPQSSG